jgi:hypothetical protein
MNRAGSRYLARFVFHWQIMFDDRPAQISTIKAITTTLP